MISVIAPILFRSRFPSRWERGLVELLSRERIHFKKDPAIFNFFDLLKWLFILKSQCKKTYEIVEFPEVHKQFRTQGESLQQYSNTSAHGMYALTSTISITSPNGIAQKGGERKEYI